MGAREVVFPRGLVQPRQPLLGVGVTTADVRQATEDADGSGPVATSRRHFRTSDQRGTAPEELTTKYACPTGIVAGPRSKTWVPVNGTLAGAVWDGLIAAKSVGCAGWSL